MLSVLLLGEECWPEAAFFAFSCLLFPPSLFGLHFLLFGLPFHSLFPLGQYCSFWPLSDFISFFFFCWEAQGC